MSGHPHSTITQNDSKTHFPILTRDSYVSSPKNPFVFSKRLSLSANNMQHPVKGKANCETKKKSLY